jgi:PadR family transcriptional regulator PadR
MGLALGRETHDRIPVMGRRDPSLSTLRVLRALLEQPTGQFYGLQLAEGIGIKAGVLYPILTRLEEDGWITGDWEDIDESAAGRRRRRWYRLTDEGQREARDLISKVNTELALPARATGKRRLNPEPAS